MSVLRKSPRNRNTTSDTSTKRFKQRVQNLLDRGIQKAGRGRVGHGVVHARWKLLGFDFFDLRLNTFNDFGRIGAWRLLQNNGRRRQAVNVGVQVIERRPERDLRDVLDSQDFALSDSPSE